MRPLELRVRNFRSYFVTGDQEVIFDFRDRRLVGIVGPIGSGKSSILDAIAFALYGRTPRIARSTKSLVHQRAPDAAVALRFRVDGEVWEAVRSLRRKGQSQHALYRFPDDLPDVEPVEKIVLESEVNERIEQLLGFDYGAFSRSVMLAQGQFAEFLTAAPGQRDKVLKGVFGHERLDAMRDLAKARVAEGEHELDKLEIRLGETRRAMERIAEDETTLATASARLSDLTERHVEIDALTARRAEIAERRKSAETTRADLAERAAQMPDAEDTEALLSTALEAAEQRASLAAEVEAAHVALTNAEAVTRSEDHLDRRASVGSAEKLLAELESRTREADRAAEQQKAATSTAAEAAAAVEKAKATLAETEADAETAKKTLATADAAVTAAREVLHAAHQADMASALRSGLEPGDECPVCTREVDEVPQSLASDDVGGLDEELRATEAERAAAERANVAAQTALAAARQAAGGAEQRQGEFAEHLNAATSAAAAAADVVAGLAADLVDLLGVGDPAERLGELRAGLEAEKAAHDAARRHLDDRRRAQQASIDGEQETQRALGDLRSRLGAMARHLDPDAEVPSDDPADLRVALERVRSRWSDAQSTLAETVATADEEMDEVQAALAAIHDELKLVDGYEASHARAEAAVSMLTDRIRRDRGLVAGAEDLVAADTARRDELELLRRLASDLTDTRFIRYLLDEERSQLAELGSEHFQRLSSGRYRFTDGIALEVVDLTSADAVRKADSLSGGETFLASLALALGLAEMVSRSGGRLEAFFLDEGFGSLDAEHLDLAMEGIERLVTDGGDRLVVVVSHVAELRERLEDLIVLDRDPTTGDSRIVHG